MEKIIILIIAMLLLVSCWNKECENQSILKDVTYFTVGDWLFWQDEVHAKLEYNNWLSRTERVGQTKYIIWKTYCDDTFWSGTYKLK
jgi:hypothetical protein